MEYSYSDVSKMIDHAILQPQTTPEQLRSGLQLALAYDVASVCIMPCYLNHCAEVLSESTVKPSTVIGFPHGAHATSIKAKEAEQAIADGGEELDMVVNISKVIAGDWDYVTADIKAVVDVAHGAGQLVKVIFENCYLDDAQKIRLCEICAALKPDWVKTSTGFGTGGATIDDLKLMREHSPEHVQVKAAGGVRDFDKLLEVRALGVSRVGASATQAILDAARERLGLDPIKGLATGAGSGY